MQHLAVFSTSLAAAAADTDVLLVSDGYLTVSASGKAIPPVDLKVLMAYAFGTGFDKGRLIAPSQKRLSYPRLPYFEQVTVPADLPAVNQFGDYPPIIRRGEEFNFQANNTDAGAQRQNVLAFLQDRQDTPPSGPSWVILGTITVTGAAYTWVQGNVSWEDTYPNVPLALVGLRVVGTAMIAARFIPQNGVLRPGCIATATERTDDRSFTWNGKMGKMLEFTPPQFPSMEIMVQAAGAVTCRVYAQVVPMAAL